MDNPTRTILQALDPRALVAERQRRRRIRSIAAERDTPENLVDVALTNGTGAGAFHIIARRMEVQRYCEEHGQVMVDATTLQMLEAMAERSVVPSPDESDPERTARPTRLP